ncbi:DNA repair ATPase [Metallosphaera cuprina]|uniref:DNA repair ATPase n=1 Tax=Metallosphaera cuprina (strain Ar-4) TaxID=1006006 RepID=F4G2N1_METCR|nr:DNA repair ATPase [Metallosphaera cuprina]AEB95079.1 DNA repair ATPase [Metallosphaera cuprina Ar-4]
MSGDILEKLRNDQEFIKKVADSVSQNVLVNLMKDLTTIINEKFTLFEDKYNKLIEEIKNLRQDFQDQNKKILDRLEKVEVQIVKLQEQVAKHTEAIERLQEQTNRNTEAIVKLQEQVAKHTEAIERLQEQTNRNTEAIVKLQEQVAKHTEAIERLQEQTNRNTEAIERLEKKFDETFSGVKKELSEIKSYLATMSSNLEEEGREYVEWKFEKDLGIKLEVTRLEIENVLEIDIYAEHKDFVIVGEVKNRVGISAVRELNKKITTLKRVKPETSNKKIVSIIYGLGFTREVIEYCKEQSIFATNGFKEYTQLTV